MASGEPVLLESRRVSGKGLLRNPQPRSPLCRFLTLQIQVIRKPKTEYLNFNYNPPRGRYGTLTFIRNSSVVSSEAIEYPDQSFDFIADPSGQAFLALQCQYQGLLDSFANLGTALGLNVLSVENNIASWKNLNILWDEVRLVCYADTAIDMFLFQGEYDVCPEQNPQIQIPPLPLPPPPEFERGEPLSGEEGVSSPYDGETDDGSTIPYPSDSEFEPEPSYPKGDDCEVWYVRVRINVSTGTPVETSGRVYAPIQGYGYNPAFNAFFCICKGNANSQACGANNVAVLEAIGNYVSYEVLEERPD